MVTDGRYVLVVVVGLAVRMAERKRSSAAPAAGTRNPVRRLWN